MVPGFNLPSIALDDVGKPPSMALGSTELAVDAAISVCSAEYSVVGSISG